MNAKNKRVLIVENHAIVCHVIKANLIDIDSAIDVTVARDIDDALLSLQDEVAARSWFRIFLDIDMPDAQSLVLLKRCTELNITQRCVAITGMANQHYVAEVRQMGVLELIRKNSFLEDFKNDLVSTLNGEALVQRQTSKSFDRILFTPYRQHILGLLQRGYSSKKMAILLGISVDSMNHHVRDLMRALNTSNRTYTVTKAIELGYLNALNALDAPASDDGHLAVRPRHLVPLGW